MQALAASCEELRARNGKPPLYIILMLGYSFVPFYDLVNYRVSPQKLDTV
jgi:hypothetical protein